MSRSVAVLSSFISPLTSLPLTRSQTATPALSVSVYRRCLKMASPASNSALVSASQLADELKSSRNAPQLLDATWYLPGSDRDSKKEFELDRLPGAKRFDIDAPNLKANSTLPHMMPALDDAAERAAVTSLVSSTKPLVIYAQGGSGGMAGLVASARVWFHFRAMGHPNVRVLDGGLWTFRQQGYTHGKGEMTVSEDSSADFNPTMNKSMVWSLNDVVSNSTQPRAYLLDARSEGRFRGTEPEPRACLRGGHVPGSFSVPATECVDLKTGLLKPRDQLAAVLKERGIPEGKFAVTCGSGVTASIVALSLFELGHSDVAMYDGSWSEYGQEGLDVAVAVDRGQR